MFNGIQEFYKSLNFSATNPKDFLLDEVATFDESDDEDGPAEKRPKTVGGMHLQMLYVIPKQSINN